MTLTFCMDIIFVNGNYFWKFHARSIVKKCDRQTDKQMDRAVHRAARSKLKLLLNYTWYLKKILPLISLKSLSSAYINSTFTQAPPMRLPRNIVKLAAASFSVPNVMYASDSLEIYTCISTRCNQFLKCRINLRRSKCNFTFYIIFQHRNGFKRLSSLTEGLNMVPSLITDTILSQSEWDRVDVWRLYFFNNHLWVHYVPYEIK